MKKKILHCLDTFRNDPALVPELNTIIRQEGPKACQAIIHILTHLDMTQAEAVDNWEKILLHHQKLNAALHRDLSLTTAVCDYFSDINRSLTNPKVVEIHVFEKAVQDSMRDHLTGLFNRHGFDREVSREFYRSKRYGNEFSILFLDLDDFKKVNDDFGHQAGDLILKKAAGIIENGKRTADMAARYGGEEFVIVLPHTQKKDAMTVGERIRRRLEKSKIVFEGRQIPITLSGGLASFPSDTNDLKDLIYQADMALNRAKTGGKNQICVFSPDKRHFVRIKTRREIKVRELGFTSASEGRGKSKDLSIGGLLFENPFPFHLGTSLQINISMEKEPPLLAIGKVVRVEELDSGLFDIGVSLSLSEIDKTVKDRINQWMKHQGN